MKKDVTIIIAVLIICFPIFNCEDARDSFTGITTTVEDSTSSKGFTVLSSDPDDWLLETTPAWPDSFPSRYPIGPAFPNPAESEAFIFFGLPEKDLIKFYIRNISDDIVAHIWDDSLSAGYWHIRWDLKDDDGKKLRSGIYRCYYEWDTQIGDVTYNFEGYGDIQIK